MIAMDETVKKLYEDMCKLEEKMQALSIKVSKLIDDYVLFQYELKESTYTSEFDDSHYATGLLEEE